MVIMAPVKVVNPHHHFPAQSNFISLTIPRGVLNIFVLFVHVMYVFVYIHLSLGNLVATYWEIASHSFFFFFGFGLTSLSRLFQLI